MCMSVCVGGGGGGEGLNTANKILLSIDAKA